MVESSVVQLTFLPTFPTPQKIQHLAKAPHSRNPLLDIDHRPRLLENRSRRAGHWVSVRLQGTSSNRDGIGALVRVTADGTTWTRDMRRTDGLFSSNDPRLHFGLGEASSITAIEVTWPSGKVQRVESPELDSRIVITEPE